jgi:hypothetical protein
MVLLSKALSGGFVPVGALLTKNWIFAKLFDRAAEGRAFWRVYRQFKMYNDATLNPYLYGGKR